MLPALLLLFLLLPLTEASAVVPAAASPLFASCSATQRCEGTAVCRFNICLPPTNPVPVYAHGNKTFTIQPSAKVSPFGATMRPVQSVRNFVLQGPKGTLTIAVSCQPKCVGSASCLQGSCRCSPGIAYSPISGCLTNPGGRPMQAVPVAPIRIIPQILPGDRCDPGAECTGGSQCSLGICACPPELVQQGGVCVSPASMGLPHLGLPGYQ